MIQKTARIIYNSNKAGNYYKLALDAAEVARIAKPGQFVMLRVSDNYQTLLRRPFSVHGLGKANTIEILYEVIGKGTKILSQKKAGQGLDVLGPLGNGFSIIDSRYSILVAGGMGIAPLLFLAQKLSTLNRQHSTILIGARTKKEILCQKEFARLGLGVKICTDDGSSGFKGKVTALLKNILRNTHDARPKTIYACGPKPMLAEICVISKHYNIPAQVSLDEYMACGLGLCLGCAVKTRQGQKLVCRDGPVFDASTLMLK